MERNRKNFMKGVAFEIIFDKRAKCCQVEIWRRLIQAKVGKGGYVSQGEIEKNLER